DEAYHGPLGRIVRAVEGYTEADPAGLLVTLITVIGCAMGGSRGIYQGSRQTPNVFAVQVGDTGVGRKGTTYRLARDILQPVLDVRDLSIGGLGSGEALVVAMDDRRPETRALIVEEEMAAVLAAASR